MHDDTEYDQKRVTESFLRDCRRTEKRMNVRFLVAGLLAGVALSTGSAYAVYFAEMTYETEYSLGAPAIGEPTVPVSTDHPGWQRPPQGNGPRFNDRVERRNRNGVTRPPAPMPPTAESE